MKAKLTSFALLFVLLNSSFFILNSEAQWEQMSNGMGTDRTVHSLAVNGNKIFAGISPIGLWLTTNNGQNWAQTDLFYVSVISFAISGNYIFAGTNGSGVHLSTNNGQSWTQTALNNRVVHSLAVNGIWLFAGTDQGIYRSIDNGSNWALSVFLNETLSFAKCGDNMFAGTMNSGIYHSTDNGNYWHGVLSSKTVQSLAASGDNMFAGTLNYFGVYRSTTAGLGWSQTSLNNKTVYSLAISGNNIFAGTWFYGVYHSEDNGSNWTEKNQGWSVIPDVKALLIANNYIFAGTEGKSVWRRILTDFTLPSSPVLISPVNNSVGQPLSLNLVWNKSQYSSKYTVLLSTDSLFNNVIINDSLLTDSVKTISNLIPLTNYYWKVSAGNGSGWSSYSSTYSFKTIGSPTQVVPNLPANNSINQPVNITFKWYKAIDQTFKTNRAVSNYWLEYSTDSTFVNNVVKDSTLTDSLKSVTGLNTAAKYYWRVKAKNTVGWGNFSSIWNFTTIVPIPSAPALIAPANNSTGNPLNINLIWSKPQYATGYNLILATDAAFTNIILNDSLLTDSVKALTNLNSLTNYYWKIRAKNIAGWSAFSSYYTFKTVGAPTQVVLSLPANYAANQPVNIAFKWFKAIDQTYSNILIGNSNKGEDTDDPNTVSNYWLEYSTDSTFVNNVVKDSTLTDSLKSVTGLNTAAKYYWRVKAKNTVGWGNFSSIWNFTTVPPLPIAPVLVSPPNGATNLAPDVMLDWNAVQYAAGYRIQIASDSLFTNTVKDTSSVVQDTLRIRPGLLSLNTKYYWRVNATNVSGTGQWSTVWNFRINPTGINQIGNEIPAEYSLNQNYPNPFNPVTKIKFDIAINGNASLIIFDITGKEIATLVNESLQPGTYSVDWKASDFPSGIYFYRLQTGSFTDTKRMILIK